MSNKRPNQCVRIIKYLEDFKTITSAEAMQDLGVYRLASRINELKKAGYPIKRTMIAGLNRWGETVHYAQYSMEEKAV